MLDNFDAQHLLPGHTPNMVYEFLKQAAENPTVDDEILNYADHYLSIPGIDSWFTMTKQQLDAETARLQAEQDKAKNDKRQK